MDFRLDMYTLSDVFLSHAAWTRRSSASLFWEVVVWMWQLSTSFVSLPIGSSTSGFDGSWVVVVNSSIGVFVSSRSNVTVFTGLTGLVGGVSSSDSSESYRVSLPVESSSDVGSRVASGFRSFWNCRMQMWVGCSPPHSSHRSWIFASHLST